MTSTNSQKKHWQNSQKKYEEDKQTIGRFKTELEKFVKEITRGDGKTQESNPLVFFIDELDRCRPDYAVQLLEKAKHLFNIPSIVFVLAVDKDQIGHSLRCLYGAGMDVDGYLRRFIDLDYSLPDPEKGAFCKALFEKFAMLSYFQNRKVEDASYDLKNFMGILTELFSLFKFSLRMQEQCFTQISLVCRTTPPNHFLDVELLGTLLILKSVNPDLYR